MASRSSHRSCRYVDLPKVNKKLLCAVSFEPPMQVLLNPNIL